MIASCCAIHVSRMKKRWKRHGAFCYRFRWPIGSDLPFGHFVLRDHIFLKGNPSSYVLGEHSCTMHIALSVPFCFCYKICHYHSWCFKNYLSMMVSESILTFPIATIELELGSAVHNKFLQLERKYKLSFSNSSQGNLFLAEDDKFWDLSTGIQSFKLISYKTYWKKWH